eukprot:128159-Prorocentrum_minimum.AAC.2
MASKSSPSANHRSKAVRAHALSPSAAPPPVARIRTRPYLLELAHCIGTEAPPVVCTDGGGGGGGYGGGGGGGGTACYKCGLDGHWARYAAALFPNCS